MLRQVPKKLLPIYTITFFDTVATTIGFPILTFLCFDVHSTLFAANASHAVRSFWFGVCSGLPHSITIVTATLMSFISDSFGRKKMLIIGAVGALLFCFFATLSILLGALGLLLLGYLIAGLCTRTQPIALAVVGDLSAPKAKILNMSYLQSSIALGAFLGPLIGGYFAQRFFFATFNFSFPYLIGIGLALLTVILTIFYFQESFKPVVKRKIIWRELLNSKILKISLVLLLTQISWRTYYQFMPPVLKVNFHSSPETIGLFMAMIAVWLAIATLFGMKILCNHFSVNKIILIACWVELFGLILAIFGCTIPVPEFGKWLIWGSSVPIAMSDVLLFSALSALYSEAVTEHNQGKVMGLLFIIVSAVWCITGFVGGIIAGVNIILPIIIAPISLIILFLVTKYEFKFS